MDKERTARELKRTKRQQRALSYLHHSSSRINQLSVLCNGGGGDGKVDLSERWKKEKGRASRGSSSSEDSEMAGDGRGSDCEEELRPVLTTTTSISSRKRVKLHGKVLDDYIAVDPAVVPRKLRSAIYKRSSESASPPLTDAKKYHHSSNGITSPNLNSAKRSKQNKLHDQLTKDEEEVAETLFALAQMTPLTKHVKNGIDRRLPEEKSDTMIATSALLSEAASKEETVKIPLSSTFMDATKISSCVEESFEEAVNIQSVIEPTVLEQPTTLSGSKKFNLEQTITTEENLQSTVPLLKNEHLTNLTDAMNLSNPVDASSEIHSSNGILQTRLFEALPLEKPEIRLWPVTSAATEQELHVKKKTESIARLACQEEETLEMQPDLSSTRGHLTWSSPAKAAVWLDSASCAARPGSTGNDHSTEKIHLVSVDRRQSWKKCATHVYISRIIQNYQNTEKTHQLTLPANHSKHSEGIRVGVVAGNECAGFKNGVSSIVGAHGSSLERNQHEARVGVLHDTRIQHDQQAPTPSRVYSQQKPECDFLSTSAGCKSSNSGNGLESSRQLPVPYLHHPLPPPHHHHHPLMPFFIPPYPSPYSDQLAAAAAVQQVKFQLPNYLGNTLEQQQHQMWQAHLAHYSPQQGTIPKWQNGGRPQDSSSNPPSRAQPQAEPVIFPYPPPKEVYGRRITSLHQPAAIPPHVGPLIGGGR